jgi:DNA helicase-2/ATP-dependent DNA helicase PcrA
MLGCIDARTSFVLEAGAGAGKTHSLVEALRHLVRTRGDQLLQKAQRIACITYTNVASDEIKSRVGGDETVFTGTIHAFCWSLIAPFQPALRAAIVSLPKWPERLAGVGGIGVRRVEYNLGHPVVNDEAVLLHHDDVPALAAALMKQDKFRSLLTARYPVILIDEYQDTNRDFAESLQKHFVATESGPLIGFFGDHWQRIYDRTCGEVQEPKLVRIGKGANFRSAPAIVRVLNAMRPSLLQEVRDPHAIGSAVVYHANGWSGERRRESVWKGDLPDDAAHEALEKTKGILRASGWDFDPSRTKILMLTHRVLAREQGYSGILHAFEGDGSEPYAKKEDPYIKFLVELVEPVCDAYANKRFGAMFELLGDGPTIRTPDDKLVWARDMDALLDLRTRGTIGGVVAFLKTNGRIPVPDDVMAIEGIRDNPTGLSDSDSKRCKRATALAAVQFSEIGLLRKFIEDETPFATKHGVKGAEFEDVLVVMGRGWAQYDFNRMLEYFASNPPPDKLDFFERNRNLFYVACSRPKRRLALLFTQTLSEEALGRLTGWFGEANVANLY